MPDPALAALLASLEPELQPGVWVYAQLPTTARVSDLHALACFREAEGWTVVVAEETAQAAGLAVRFRAAWITLTVHSALEAIGLTAAFATALAEAGIACNVMAGVCHDHLFVPVAQGSAALTCLRTLQQRAAAGAALAERPTGPTQTAERRN
jgi:hypothetical protein